MDKKQRELLNANLTLLRGRELIQSFTLHEDGSYTIVPNKAVDKVKALSLMFGHTGQPAPDRTPCLGLMYEQSASQQDECTAPPPQIAQQWMPRSEQHGSLVWEYLRFPEGGIKGAQVRIVGGGISALKKELATEFCTRDTKTVCQQACPHCKLKA